MDKMDLWRDGIFSDAETLRYLLEDMANINLAISEVQAAMINHENHEAERNLAKTA